MFLSSPGFVTRRSRWPRAPGQGGEGALGFAPAGCPGGCCMGTSGSAGERGKEGPVAQGDICATADPP